MRYSLLLCAGVFAVIVMLAGCSGKLTEEQLYSRGADLEQKAIALDAQGQTAEANDLLAQAAKSYEKLIADYPESERAHELLYQLGTVYMNNLKDAEKSVEAYQRLIEQYPESEHIAKAYFMIGYRYANEIGDLKKAKEAYSLFLEKYPDHELAMSVHWELENLGKDVTDFEFLDEESPEGRGKRIKK